MANPAVWSFMFRLTINDPRNGENKDAGLLGDRTLTGWLNNANYYHFPTYYYSCLNNNGNTNSYNNLGIGQSSEQWNFIYYAYSRAEVKASGFVQFLDRTVDFSNPARHYLTNKFFFNLGADNYYPAYNGAIRNANLVFGSGAYSTSSDAIFNAANDLW